MNTSFNQKIALVTGAAGVCGLATTKALLAQGCKVVMADVNQETLHLQAHALGTSVMPLVIDIRRFEDVCQGVSEVMMVWGRVDILVNNAGILSNHKSQNYEKSSDCHWRWQRNCFPTKRMHTNGRLLRRGATDGDFSSFGFAI